MKKKDQIHNLVILDESGSMESIKKTIIQGFNEVVQTIKEMEKQFPDQEHFVSFVSFNNRGNKLHHFMDPASQLTKLNDENYSPCGTTPLFDSMGFSFNKLKGELKEHADYNVLVTIFTDGEENASKEYSGSQIKKLIEDLKQKRWTFTYIGTDHDVEKIAASLSINNTLAFKKNQADIESMFAKERVSRGNYYNKISLKDDTMSNYFDDPDDSV